MPHDRQPFDELVVRTRDFAEVRGWLGYHDPKNLAMAVASEAGELLAEFRWLTSEEARAQQLSPVQLDAVSMEMADVLIFLVRLADVLGLDLVELANEKLDRNEIRFPPVA